jgi:hypothetical protein
MDCAMTVRQRQNRSPVVEQYTLIMLEGQGGFNMSASDVLQQGLVMGLMTQFFALDGMFDSDVSRSYHVFD